VVGRANDEGYGPVIIGSYTDLTAFNNIDLVTGLCSLDDADDIETAMQQIKNSLRIGGHCIHIRDRGINYASWTTALRELYGLDSVLAMYDDPGEDQKKTIIACVLPDEGIVSTNEIIRRYIESVICKIEGLELILNEWRVAETKHDDGIGYFTQGSLYLPFGQNTKSNSMITSTVTVVRRTS